MNNPLTEHLHTVINRVWNYAKRCETRKDELLNAAFGLAGEAGEVADQYKKYFFHTKKDDALHREKLVYELGDVFFYATKLMDLENITLEEVLEKNREKLASRHPELGQVTERFGAGAIR